VIRLAVRGMVERRLRSALTGIAVLLGVAMIAGTYVLTDQIHNAFSDINRTANRGRDAVISQGTGFSSSFQTQEEQLPEALVAKVARQPEVAMAAGELQAFGSLVVNGNLIENRGQPGFVFSAMPAELDPTDPVEGRDPRAPGEISVSADLAQDQGVEVGDRLELSTNKGVEPVRVVGLVDFGDSGSAGGFGFTLATLRDVQRWYDKRGQVTEIAVAAKPGVTSSQLVRRLESIVPQGAQVQTGQQNADDATKEATDSINSFLGPALLAFAGAALLVGAFIIFNTFSISVAERTREFASLRTLGATRGQVLRWVSAEALAIGVIASLAGLVAGLGFAKLVAKLVDATGSSIPTAGLELRPRTIALGLGVGIGVTLLASLVPAARATRIPPAIALAEGARIPRGRLARLAPYFGALVLAGGIALLVAGLFGSGPAASRLLEMAFGAGLCFVGVALLSRYVVVPVAGVVGYPLERASAVIGRLARENAQRNPGRTAITAAALMVGLGLVVFVAVFAAGLNASVTGSIDRLLTADLVVRTDTGFNAIPREAARDLARVPGVQASVPFTFDQVEVDGRPSNPIYDIVSAADPRTIADVYRFDWVDGSDRLLDGLGRNEALIEQQFAKARHVDVGDSYRVETASGGKATFRAAGEYKDPLLLQGMIVAPKTLRAISPARDPILILATDEPGSNPATVEAAAKRALAAFPIAEVSDQAGLRDQVRQQTNRIVYLLYALLGMSVVISLFGIANSLFLSIHERTREFGLLRAVGATRGQVRRMVRYESVITAVIGGLLGTVIGIGFAAMITASLSGLGLTFSLPVGQLIIFGALAVLVGVLASVGPARRGSRLDLIESLHYE
jgi:putative ABC transport system permease protein